MKKSLLALAVLGAFAGAASAQSNVTLYGRVDLGVGKGAGTDLKSMNNGSGSRFGVRGVEDLGGGLQALFNIEHRYNADTGVAGAGNPFASSAAPRFWHARSIVGLQGGFGQVVFGREYTTAFLQSQLVADPWGWDTVVAGQFGGSGGNTAVTGGGIAAVRNDSSATYKISFGGFTFGAQIAEATDSINNFANKPVNFALSYAGGPITAGLGFERTGAEIVDNAQWMTLNAAYNFGAFKVGGLIGRGTTAGGVDRSSWLVTATAPIGAGEFRASYGVLDDDVLGKINKPLALGYHYSMSKRTTLYADFINDRGALFTDNKTGYDFGVKHNF
jgi:predicted porin